MDVEEIPMSIKQLSVFLENVPGRLKGLTEVLADNNINMRAITLADTSDFGIIRVIVDDNDKAVQVLKEAGFVAKLTNILAVAMDDEPGALLKLLDVMEKGQINIEYMYAFKASCENRALLVVKVNKHEKAKEALLEAGLIVLAQQDDLMRLI